MKNKRNQISIIIMLAMLFITLAIPKSLALTPGQMTGEITGDKTIDVEFVTKLEDMIRLIGTFIAVGAMMIIGIKYMTGSIEEKANYKKTMFPYLIGCILLFGASHIAPQIVELFKETQTAEAIGNTALGLIQTIGTFIAIAVLMILGIKYMVGSIEERATYKKSMLPYIVGAVLLFAAVNITAVIADNVSFEESSEKKENYRADGKSDGLVFTQTHSEQEIRAEYNRAMEEYLKAVNADNRDNNAIQYWSSYTNALDNYLSSLNRP